MTKPYSSDFRDSLKAHYTKDRLPAERAGYNRYSVEDCATTRSGEPFVLFDCCGWTPAFAAVDVLATLQSTTVCWKYEARVHAPLLVVSNPAELFARFANSMMLAMDQLPKYIRPHYYYNFFEVSSPIEREIRYGAAAYVPVATSLVPLLQPL